jgi:hypothetical protein
MIGTSAPRSAASARPILTLLLDAQGKSLVSTSINVLALASSTAVCRSHSGALLARLSPSHASTMTKLV